MERGGRSVEGLREIMAAMAALFVHTVLVKYFNQDELSWQSFLGALVAAAMVWGLFDWMIRRWIEKQEIIWQERENQKYNVIGGWGAIVSEEGKNDPIAVSILNIHPSTTGLSVEGRSLDCVRGEDGRVSFRLGGDWHSTQAAFSEKTLLYLFSSHTERVSGVCSYTFTWPDPQKPPRGYSGTFYEFGRGAARNVQGARIGGPVDLADVPDLNLTAHKIYEFFCKVEPSVTAVKPASETEKKD